MKKLGLALEGKESSAVVSLLQNISTWQDVKVWSRVCVSTETGEEKQIPLLSHFFRPPTLSSRGGDENPFKLVPFLAKLGYDFNLSCTTSPNDDDRLIFVLLRRILTGFNIGKLYKCLQLLLVSYKLRVDVRNGRGESPLELVIRQLALPRQNRRMKRIYLLCRLFVSHGASVRGVVINFGTLSYSRQLDKTLRLAVMAGASLTSGLLSNIIPIRPEDRGNIENLRCWLCRELEKNRPSLKLLSTVAVRRRGVKEKIGKLDHCPPPIRLQIETLFGTEDGTESDTLSCYD